MAIQYSKLNALVADDFSSFRSTVNGMLLNMGVQKVVMASNGEEIINQCQNTSFDIILSDYNLGEGRNGQHVLEELRHRSLIDWRSVFIIVSAEASRNIVMAAYDCEPDDYLMKPITPHMLQKRIERLMEQRKYFKPVHSAIEQNELNYAADLLVDMSLSENRHSVLAQKLLGELFLKLGEFDKAEKVYTRALEIRQLEWARLGLARVKQLQGDIDQSSNWLEKLVHDNPLYLPAYDVLADNCVKKGDTNNEQNAVMRATDVSPMSILRQKRLTAVAKKNRDVGTAIDAARKTVRLGKLSCHGCADDSLDYAATVLQGKVDNYDLEPPLLKDAISVLDSMTQFGELSQRQQMQQAALKTLVQRVDDNQPVTQQELTAVLELGDTFDDDTYSEGVTIQTAAIDFPDPVEEANTEEEKRPLERDIESDITQVRSLLSQGKDLAASTLLDELQIIYQDDESALTRLDEFLDEPVSEENRDLVSQVNKEGIALYSDGRYLDALDCFERARSLFPKHVGILLNISQCLIGLLRQNPTDDVIYAQCEDSLDFVEGLIAPDNVQYERYAKLRKLVARGS